MHTKKKVQIIQCSIGGQRSSLVEHWLLGFQGTMVQIPVGEKNVSSLFFSCDLSIAIYPRIKNMFKKTC